MRIKMSREQCNAANFLLSAIKDYGIHNFDVDSLKVKEGAYSDDSLKFVSYSVTVGANVVSIEYYYKNCRYPRAYVYLNDYSLAHCKVTCHSDMSRVVSAFATLVQHLN